MIEEKYVCPMCGLTLNEKQMQEINPPLMVTTVNCNTGKIVEKFGKITPQTIEELQWRKCTQCNNEVVYKKQNEWREKHMPELNENPRLTGDTVSSVAGKDESTVGEIANEGEIVKFTNKKGEQEEFFKVGIKLSNSIEYDWVPNKTTRLKIINKYGKKTVEWIGKKIRLKAVTQNLAGELKKIVYGEPA